MSVYTFLQPDWLSRCCFHFIVFFYPRCCRGRSTFLPLCSASIRRRDKCGCHDTRGSQRARWNLPVCRDRPVTDSGPTFHLLTFSSMLIINPTYRALPVSLHHKLTFILLFFSVLLSPFFPFTLSPPPPTLFSSSCSKVVHVKIIDDEEYEKNKNFFLELAEPRMVDMSLQKGAVLNLSLSLSLFLSLSCHFLCLSLSHVVSSLSPPSPPGCLLCPLPFRSAVSAPFLTPCLPSSVLHRCARKNSISSPCLHMAPPAQSRHKRTIAIPTTTSPDDAVICIKTEQGVEELLWFTVSWEHAAVIM